MVVELDRALRAGQGAGELHVVFVDVVQAPASAAIAISGIAQIPVSRSILPT